MDYLDGMCAVDFRIECCAAEGRAEALRLLHAGLSIDQQTALPSALDSVREQGEAAFSGLLVAKDHHGLRGAVWVQPVPGSTAVVWPPAIRGAASAELMRAVAELLDRQRISLAQILVSPEAPHDPHLWSTGGFCRLVDLDYLTVERSQYPAEPPTSALRFQPAASEDPERLGKLVLETYQQTLDCPQLNGLRRVEDILAGYAAQGKFSAERWFFVRQRDSDVGVLILTEHPVGDTWELVYMGVIPDARGNGFGSQIVRFAMARAAEAEAERLVLAVDEKNAPALAMYCDAGFTTWDHRTVYARLKPQNADSP